MAGLAGLLDTAKQALFAQQAAIQVVGQNIANVNTPGYTRERPVFLPAPSRLESIVLGGGVNVDRIERVYDRFIATQINVATANFQGTQTQADLLGQVEALFNDLSLGEEGLAGSLESFFQGFQELAGDPQGMPERTVLQQRGALVASTVRDLHTGLENLGRDVNAMLKDELSEVSRLASQIADLNLKIQQVEVDPKNPANAFRDQRDELLKQLSEKVSITSFDNSNGQFTVLLGGARPLIEGTRANSLVAAADPDTPENLLVRMQDPQGNTIDVSPNLLSGKIQGLLAVRDTVLPRFTSDLDRLAAQLTSSVNQTHSAGFALDGTTGNDFFVARQASGQALANNTGGSMLESVTVFDPTQLTLDDYRVTFTSNGSPQTYDIVNATTGAALATGQTYTPGNAIQFAGVEVVIDGTGGAPQTGDTFLISSTKDAAKRLAVDAGVLHNPKRIAAAAEPVPGDNANALALAQLRDAPSIDTLSFGAFYSGLVSRVGAEKQQATFLAEQRQLVVTEVQNRRDALSGVSLDEEQLDLIRFQQAFGAAANFLRVADEMAQTVLGLVR